MQAVVPITEAERAQRMEHYRSAAGNLRIEGMELDAETRALFEKYVEGELSLPELGRAIRALNERDFGPLRLPRD